MELIRLIKNDFQNLEAGQRDSMQGKYSALINVDLLSLSQKELTEAIVNLRAFRLEIIQRARDLKLKRNVIRLKVTLANLKDKKIFRQIDPVGFEHIICECFKIIDDEIEIKSNCVVDDNGNPISFAPGNRADSEGYYKTFNSIFEVTLDVSRHQVYRESVPIMRHLKDFDNKNPGKPAFCIFIAPRIHDDTVNYFWYAVKHGFEGGRQKIIALELNQLIVILEFFINATENGKSFSHYDLGALFDAVISDADSKKSSVEWFRNISAKIKEWQEALA